MTTRYVSNAGTNGYAVGNDANSAAQATSKATPWLTLTHAVAAMTAGDTIVLNAGTYAEASFVNVGATGSGSTFKADTGLTATIRDATGADTRVLHVAAAATGLTLGATDGSLVIDANSQQTNAVTTDSVTQFAALTLQTVTLKGWKTNGLNAVDIQNLQVLNCTVLGAPVNTGGAGILLQPRTGSATDNYTVSGCTIALGAVGALTTYGIFENGSGAGAHLTLQNNIITATVPTGVATVWGIRHTNGEIVLDSGNLITFIAAGAINASSDLEGIFVQSPALGQTTSCVIHDNTVTLPIDTLGSSGFVGRGIGVGSDSSASAGPVGPTGYNEMAGILVYANKIIGGNHGLFLGWVCNALVWGNTISNTVLGCIDKHCGTNYGGTYKNLPNIWSGNIVNYIQDSVGTNGCLYAKASIGTIFANNLVILDSVSYVSPFMKAAQDPTGTVVNSSGIIFKNNLLYATGIAPTNAALVGSGTDASSATFQNNDYYSTVGFANNAWNYGASAYANFAAWVAAKEASALNVDPTFYNYAGGDYRVPPSNASLYRAGVFAHAWAVDFRGRPFWTPPTIGAYEVSAGDRVATRTARS